MNSDKLNSWLGVFSNIGVLAGLIFLAVELQQNTNVARSSAYREHIQSYADWREMVIADPELTLIWESWRSNDTEELDEIQNARLFRLGQSLLGIYESAYYSYRTGILQAEEWERFASPTCFNYAVYKLNGVELPRGLTAGFQEYIETNCDITL